MIFEKTSVANYSSTTAIKSNILVIISSAASKRARVLPSRSLDLFYVINRVVFHSPNLPVTSIARFANQNGFDFGCNRNSRFIITGPTQFYLPTQLRV